jgi:MipA family protein
MNRYIVAASACFVALPAFAQQPPVERPADRNSVNIGIGASVRPSYSGSNDYVVGPAAIIRGKVAGFSFETTGPELSVDLIRKASDNGFKFKIGPVAGVGLNRTSQIRDPRVAALGNIRAAAHLGAFVGVQKSGIITSPFDSLSLEVSHVRDVGTVHKSSITNAKIQYATPLSTKTFVSVAASATIVGDRYARTYYAASGLRSYDLDGGIKDIGVSFIGAQSLGKDIRRGASLFLVAGYSKLLGDFKDSPIVSDAGSSNQAFAAFGVGYSF